MFVYVSHASLVPEETREGIGFPETGVVSCQVGVGIEPGLSGRAATRSPSHRSSFSQAHQTDVIPK